MLGADINLVAIIIAAVANMILGMIWYSPQVFGTKWMKLQKINPKDKKVMDKMKEESKPAMFGSMGASVVTAFVLAHVVDLAGATTLMEGLQLGFWLWLGLVATWTLTDALYHNVDMKLWYINVGYKLVGTMIMAAVLASWV